MRIGCIIAEKANGSVEMVEGGRDIQGLKDIYKKMKIEGKAENREVVLFVSGRPHSRFKNNSAEDVKVRKAKKVDKKK